MGTEPRTKMTPKAKLTEEIAVSNLLGEGIQWRHEDQSLWWTDILAQKLYRYDLDGANVRTWDMPEPLGSFAFTSDPDVIVAAFASGFAMFGLRTCSTSWISRPTFLPGEGRFNDGRADRQGRFWSGTMMADPEGIDPAVGRLFRLDLDGQVSVHETNINISNGLCWSPDSSNLYFADSLKGEIYRYAFDAKSGNCRQRTVFAEAPTGGSPDGAAVDAYGNLWSAQWGLGEIHVYTKEGELTGAITVPASQPTCVAFGGDNMDMLFVSSAKDGLSDIELAKQPSAGNVFVYKTNTKGMPENRFMGSMAVLQEE